MKSIFYVIDHGVLAPNLWSGWGLFGPQTICWGGWSFYILRGEGGGHTGGTCKNRLLRVGDGGVGGGVVLASTLKNWVVYLFFHFFNLARLYSCTILTVLSYVFNTFTADDELTRHVILHFKLTWAKWHPSCVRRVKSLSYTQDSKLFLLLSYLF